MLKEEVLALLDRCADRYKAVEIALKVLLAAEETLRYTQVPAPSSPPAPAPTDE